MYTENEGPRSNPDGIGNIDAGTPITKTSHQAERKETGLSDEQSDKQALTTRTPERWWLRKRLMQG